MDRTVGSDNMNKILKLIITDNKKPLLLLVIFTVGFIALPFAYAQFTDPDRTRATITRYAGETKSMSNPEYNITFQAVVVYSGCTRTLTAEPVIKSVVIDVNLSKPNQVNKTIINKIIEKGHQVGCDLKNGNKVGGLFFTQGWN